MGNDRRRPGLRLFLFSHPRTGSHLLLRLLGRHPDLEPIAYPFWLDLALGEDKIIARTKQPCYVAKSAQASLDRAEERVHVAEKNGKIPVIADHPAFWMKAGVYKKYCPTAPPGLILRTPVVEDRHLDVPAHTFNDNTIPLPIPNPTFLPDRFLKSFTPIFSIRHPARMIPSWHKVAARPDTLQLSVDEPAWAVYCTYRWVREVFDCYRAYMTARGPSATRPLVVDCDDMIANTRGVMRALCVYIGIDEGEVDYTWTPDMFPTHVPASTSGVNQRRQQPKLAAEYQIWVKEWGVDTAKAIEVAALAAMRDYEYLRGFRLRPL